MDRTAMGFPDARRANRMPWDRPAFILSPVAASGRTVNVSATGILVALPENLDLPVGAGVSLAIPHVDGQTSITLNGRVVRVEPGSEGFNVAVNFM